MEMNLEVKAEYRVKFPFVMKDATKFGFNGEVEAEECWVPGCNNEYVYPDDIGMIADAEGEMVLTVIDIHKPGRFPARVFYTRKFINPDGDEFGKNKLHMTTVPTFKRRASGYYFEYSVKP